MSLTLGELAARVGAELRGDPALRVHGVATLEHAGPGQLSFLSNARYRRFLSGTQATAVVLAPALSASAPVAALVSDDPYLAFARAARLLYPEPEVQGGVHPSAVIDDSARIEPSAWVGPGTIIEAGVHIGARVSVGPACSIGRDSRIAEGSRLVARVTLCHGTLVGRRNLIHPGAVVGREGFGFAKQNGGWLRIPQIGRVRLGDDVEVGANSTIDRGTLEDTVIADGVKIDNLIQIGHNVQIGENTAIVACSGISGSTRIGRNCTLAGAVGVAGHLEIGDNVHFSGMSMVTRSQKEPGSYSSGIPAGPSSQWRRNVARFRHLDEMARRLRRLEKEVAALQGGSKACDGAGD